MNTRMVIIVITAALASLLEIIDSSIVNVAIPTMMGNLGCTLDEISWVSTAYMIANSIVLPIAAWLGMRLGRRTYFTGAILAFTAASFACGMAPNLPILVICRVLQGLAGGALLPTSQTLIQEQFPREKAGMASAVFGMSVMIGPALGPTLGGYLTDNLGWRSIFSINVPIGLLAAVMAWTNVEDLKKKTANSVKESVDWLGLLFLSLGVGCFQFIMERGEVEGWWDSNAIRAASIISVSSVASFIWWELRVKHPIMNLRLFKHNAVSAGTLLMMMLGVMVYALTFVIPIFVDRTIHLTATQTGLLFIPGSILTAMIMPIAGNAMRWMNPKYLVLFGMTVGELALFTMSRFSTITGGSDVYVPLVLRGMATGFLFIPINGMVLGQFGGEELGQVAGMMNFFRQVGGSIGIASLSTLVTRFSAQNYLDLSAKVSALDPLTYQAAAGAGMGLAHGKLPVQVGMGSPMTLGLASIYGRVMRQVFVMSFDQLCWVIMIVFSLAIIPLYMIKLDPHSTGPVLDAH